MMLMPAPQEANTKLTRQIMPNKPQKKEKGAVVPLKAEPSLFLHPSYTITRDQPNLPTEDSQGSGVI